MPLDITQIQPRIFYARFDDAYKMCMATFRIEGAKVEVKNEYENYRKYIRVYTKDNIISGYCITSKRFRLFIRNFSKKDLAPEEKVFSRKLLEAVAKANLHPSSKFSVIVCVNKENSITYNHEMAHSMFYADYKYRIKVVRLFKRIKMDVKERMMQSLSENNYKFKGYDDLEFIDEVNARVATENQIKKGFDDRVKLLKKDIEKFKTLYHDNLSSK